jgi:branched-chain amino acid transport system ATP-binding protein
VSDPVSDVRDGAEAPAPPRLACSGITVRFGGLIAVDDVSLAVPPGEIVGLVGPNGAGKSTLFGVLSGLLRPWRGTVSLNGEEVTHGSPQMRADRGLARTFQHPEIFGGLTVREHFVLAYRTRATKARIWSDLFTLGSLHPVGADERIAVDRLIESLGLGPVANQLALGLPLGMARLVELGRALARSPTVLLLDEPSSGLDSAESAEFERTLRSVASDSGVSVLIVEHDVELVMRLCAAIYVLDFGVLVARGTPDEVRRDPRVRAAYLGDERPTVSPRVGRPAPDGPDQQGETEPGEVPALAVDELCVRYGQAVAVSGVSFRIRPGHALAVLGPNGAGKSSLARGISGLVPAAAGTVHLSGQDVSDHPAHRIRRAGLIYLPEGRGIFRSLSVTDNLLMAAAAATGGRSARREALDRAFGFFPVLAERRRLRAQQLSGGEQQMLSLARALMASPQVIIADELSLGLAPAIVDVVFAGLRRARAEGVTILMIEQYVHRALEFADECLVLQRGGVLWQGPASSAGDDLLRHYLGDAMTAVP